MRIFSLLMITIIQTAQVHSETFGYRISGDYLLSELNVTSPNSGIIIYPVGYPGITRPEIITCIVTSPLFVGFEAYYLYGVGYTHYSQEVWISKSYSVSVYGRRPIETLTTGSFSSGDDMLLMETFTKQASPNKIIVINFKYPGVRRAATINWLSVKDVLNNDPSSIRLVRGGVGFNIARIQIKSRVGESLHMTLQMYGKRLTVDTWPWYVSHDGATDALLYKKYWVFDAFSPPAVKRNCGCKSGRLLPVRKN